MARAIRIERTAAVMARLPGMLLVVAAAAVSSACSTPRLMIDAENVRTNTHIVLAFEETVFNKHRVREGFSRYVAPDYKEHDATLPENADGAERTLIEQLTSELPESRLVVKRTVAQGDLVAVHALWDQKPGISRGAARVDIYRLVNARIVEHWLVQQPLTEGVGSGREIF
jgi:predicted SnoaL-like aldol condensation-catalyzing enzyme